MVMEPQKPLSTIINHILTIYIHIYIYMETPIWAVFRWARGPQSLQRRRGRGPPPRALRGGGAADAAGRLGCLGARMKRRRPAKDHVGPGGFPRNMLVL